MDFKARSQYLKGSEQFKQVLDHFGNRVKAVGGDWTFGDNLEKFNIQTENGKTTIENAALNTWTGLRAAENGFNKVIVRKLDGTPGRYTKVVVEFSK